jgi:hypothetical protein
LNCTPQKIASTEPSDFEDDFDHTTPDIDDPSREATCKAVTGHVYDIRVRDGAGNRFTR